MQVKYALTEDEFLEWMQSVRTNRHTDMSTVIQVASILTAGICFYYGWETNDAGVKIMFFLAGVLMGWNAWVYKKAWTFFAKRAYKRNELFRRERIVSFTEENVTSDAMAQHLELKWSAFTHHKESQSLFLLFQSPNIANCVPKRAFTPEQSAEFRALLGRKIPAR